MIKYPFASSSWGERELTAAHQVLATGQVAMGTQVAEFERAFARVLGVKYAVMVHSGPSAHLLSVAALCYSKRCRLQPGDEVIVPALAWGSSLFPLHQCGLRIKFVDIDPATLGIDLAKAESAISPTTRAILASSSLGSSSDFDALISLCDRHQLLLLEENSDGLGATYKGKRCGTFGRCAAFNLSHGAHLSTGEGGMVVTSDEELYHLLLALRSYGSTEQLPRPNKIDNKKSEKIYESFRLLVPGYSMRPTEVAAAIGLVQLERLPELLAARKRNALFLQNVLQAHPQVQLQRPIGESSWLAFGLVLTEGAAGKREALVEELIRQGVECRPLLSGNVATHQVVGHLNHAIHGTLPQAKKVDKQGFAIGNSHLDLSENLELVSNCLRSICR